MSKLIRYLLYIIIHKWYVFIECIKLGITLRGILHDISKLNPKEFIPYMNYFYGSIDKKDKDKFNLAWLHHQKKNKHHWQYWLLKENEDNLIPLEIPKKYLKEMLADWRGMSKANGLDTCKFWYDENKDKIIIHPECRKWLENKIYN